MSYSSVFSTKFSLESSSWGNEQIKAHSADIQVLSLMDNKWATKE